MVKFLAPYLTVQTFVFFDLSNNSLVGEIPVELGSLLKLQEIYLEVNNLIGTLPPSFENPSPLEKLYAYQNLLNGNLPETLGQLMSLKVLTIFENGFSGTIPPSIFNLSSIETVDFLFGNDLTGRVPSLNKLHGLSVFGIGDNNLGSGKAYDLRFLSTLTNTTYLQTLVISYNNLGGELPEHIAKFSKELHRFATQHNQISGNIPVGIQVLVNLEAFYADRNKLSGTIPSGIGQLQNLKLLRLEINKLSGYIPLSLGNLTNLLEIFLSKINLQGTIPSSLGSWKKLITLDFSANNHSGPIPPQVIGLSSLSKGLDLSQNNLSGSLPKEVENLKNLGILDLHANMLSGEIPSGLSSCISLELLFMGANLFQGSIPPSFSSLRGIRELNLSHNNLSGKIPEFLKSFNSIQLLDLSYNDFEGMVPVEGVFKNSSATFVAGNKNLCGGMPDFGLPVCKFEQSKRRLTTKLKIIISVFSGVISVALLLISLLLWRHSRKRKGESASLFDGNPLLKLSYQSLLKATNGFSSDNLIGIGSFGSVYKGILDQQGMVPRTLNVIQRLNIAIDVASALEYLHYHCGTPIVHCDLKPSNVLLDEEMIRHISDFGLVKFFSVGMLDYSMNQSSSLGIRGTVGYCPPEYGLGSEVSTHGDIFSFGILLLEMFTGKRPNDDMLKENLSLHSFAKRVLPEEAKDIIDPNLFQMQLIADATSNHNHNSKNTSNNTFIECSISVLEIGVSCSVESPQERMNISDVVAQLSSLRNKFIGSQLPRKRQNIGTLQVAANAILSLK
ncbi:LRR receptor-like serine/threonine-protein kinase EFR [Hevea brasiliensis]|uniref:LRR receptor-like serine/threonine-protein kinase EFR n=1 Tax=Hevea brasiliensis TaxID=3981 RepID=UPI0025F01DE4|nr:LRR receptor-like serine/threonine-protein kinase EFR [Hevea brasiliensis]